MLRPLNYQLKILCFTPGIASRLYIACLACCRDSALLFSAFAVHYLRFIYFQLSLKKKIDVCILDSKSVSYVVMKLSHSNVKYAVD